MKRLTKKIVVWLLKIITKPKMNPKLTRAQKSYLGLKTNVESKISELQKFIKGGNPLLPSGDAYKAIIENFEQIGPDSFRFSVHGRKFLAMTKYTPQANGQAFVTTYESTDVLNNYPNVLLTSTNVIMNIDELNNAKINGDVVQNSVGLKYFEAISNYLYP